MLQETDRVSKHQRQTMACGDFEIQGNRCYGESISAENLKEQERTMQQTRYSLDPQHRRPMSRKGPFFYFWKMLRGLWAALTVTRRIVTNLIFLFLLAVLIAIVFRFGGETVPDGAALVFAPEGRIVEQFSQPLMGEDEILLRDIVDGIDFAGQDSKIQALLLDLNRLRPVGISKSKEISEALLRFKANGKIIIAAGDYLNQAQYYLAAHADRVYLHPLGQVWLSGYGVYRQYFKSALDRLKVTLHVFRVGTYKSALEPFIRNDMSEMAKEANSAWLNALWGVYKADVANLRNLTPAQIDAYVSGFARHLTASGGDAAQVALSFGLVDALKTRDQVRQEMIQLVGREKQRETFKQVRFIEYLDIVGPEMRRARQHAKIGLIVAQGIIMGGKQSPGRIGGDSLSALIRRSRENKHIKALVVRVDSGGGSALASEIIRREIELTRQAGIPVVISMGAVAASGGYWMSASASEIWALPTTVTGSIGIFSAFPSINAGMEALGIYSDGVGTTPLADAFNPSRPLNPILAETMQQSIENGYRRFIQTVARDRQMDPADVERIAQGRVWDGLTAHELGLVDGVGGLDSAIEAAGRLADVEAFDVVLLDRPMSPGLKLMKALKRFLNIGRLSALVEENPLFVTWQQMQADMAPIQEFNDPTGLYAFCPICRIE